MEDVVIELVKGWWGGEVESRRGRVIKGKGWWDFKGERRVGCPGG